MSICLRRALSLLLCLFSLAAVVSPAAGQSPAALAGRCSDADRIRSVSFGGDPKFSAMALASVIVTEQTSFFSHLFGRTQYMCADTLEIQRDALRLAVLHRQHGWFLANVSPQYDRQPGGIRLKFDVTAGPETRIDTIAITGLPVPDTDIHEFDAPLLALRGRIFDRVFVQARVDSVVNRLQNAGYARATEPGSAIAIDTASASDSTPAKVYLAFSFSPGARLHVGEVHVRIQGVRAEPTVDSADVMSLMGLRPNQRYRAANIVNAQRALYRTDAFRLVLIDTIAPRIGSRDSVIDLQVTVAEARTRYAKAGVGWATQDCGRVQARLQDRAFLAPGRRAEVSMRASKLGVGHPFDFAESLCSKSARDDPFSAKVNYYLGTTVSNTRFFGRPFAPTFSVYSERRGEPRIYLRETQIGALFELSSTLWRRTIVTPGVQYERGKTISDPLESCTRFNLCQPEDKDVSLFGRGVGVISTALTHDRTNDLANPTYGTRYRGELRAGLTSTSTKQNVTFYRGNGEVSGYTPLFRGTIASRLQLARVFSPNAPVVNGSPLLPQQERLFAGGQNSVRGFQQNLLGPVVYAFTRAGKDTVVQRDGAQFSEVKLGATVDQVVPRGGTALVVGNLEWRRRVRWPTDKLQLALFADAGTVFETSVQAFKWRDVRVTPGFGIRLDTPLGPFRLDIGYNPYEQRAGRALFYTGTVDGKPGSIRCISPGNTIPISGSSTTDFDLSRCPATYRPSARDALSRIVFHFSLGQPF